MTRRTLRPLLVIAILALSFDVSAIRPGSGSGQDWESEYTAPQTPAQPSIHGRAEELMQMAKHSPLAALIQGMIQFGSVTGASEQKSLLPEQRVMRFLDISADVIAAQAPQELSVLLRQMYFYDESLIESATLWRDSDGHLLSRGRYFGARVFKVEIAKEIADTPILRKIQKLMAMVEVAQTSQALAQNPGVPQRHLQPVIDVLNKITQWLLAEEILFQFHPRLLEAELGKSEMNPNIKSAILSDYTADEYVGQRARDSMLVSGDLKGDQLISWVKSIRALRDEKAQALGDGSALIERLSKGLRVMAGSQGRTHLFKLTSEARAKGDDRLGGVLRELMRRPLTCEDIF